jgi:hypothetical protein
MPSTTELNTGEFFSTFRPLFQRLSRWSADPRPPPALGDEDTPYHEVFHSYLINAYQKQ